MKGNWTCYMLAWLLVVATVAEANAQPGQYPTKPVQIRFVCWQYPGRGVADCRRWADPELESNRSW